MSNKLNKMKNFFITKEGVFIVSIATIIGTVFGISLGIIPFFGGDEAVVPADVVQTVLENHQQQLAKKDQQLLSQDELNQQLMEVVQALLQAKDDSAAEEALVQLHTGRTDKAKAYFSRWAKVANNVQAANGARYAGTLDYLTDAENAAEWYQKALQLNPNSEHSRVLQSLVNKLAASAEVSIQITTGKNSPAFNNTDINGSVIIVDQ